MKRLENSVGDFAGDEVANDHEYRNRAEDDSSDGETPFALATARSAQPDDAENDGGEADKPT
jgi:hypothetical protein